MAITVTSGNLRGTEAGRAGEAFSDHRGFAAKVFRASDNVTTGFVFLNDAGTLVYATPNTAGNGWNVSPSRP